MVVARGDGWATGHIDDMGEGPGFRKVRRELGVNALVLPPGFVSNGYWHDAQEEVYFVHRGRMRMHMRFGDGGEHLLEPSGALACNFIRDLLGTGGFDTTQPPRGPG